MLNGHFNVYKRLLGKFLYYYLTRVFGYLFVGIFINTVILLLNKNGQLIGISNLLLFAVVVLSPIVYVVLGHKQGISNFVYIFAHDFKQAFVFNIIQQYFENNQKYLDNIEESKDSILRSIRSIQNVDQNASFIKKMLVGQILNKLSFSTFLERVESSINEAIGSIDNSASQEEKIETLSGYISGCLPTENLKPSWAIPFVIIFLNIGFNLALSFAGGQIDSLLNMIVDLLY